MSASSLVARSRQSRSSGRRSGRRSRWRRRRRGRRGGCARPCPGGPRSCGCSCSRPLAGRELVGVHRQAHRAARLAPLEPGGGEDLVEPLGLGRGLHRESSRAPPSRACRRLHRRPAHDRGRGAQVLDPGVRARADEHGVDGDVADRRARLAGPCTASARARAVALASGRRTSRGRGRRRRSSRSAPGWCPRRRSAGAWRRRCSPPCRTSRRRRWRARATSSSACSHAGALRRERPALEVGERRVVGRDHARRARPASIDMLQTVMRPSIESARIAEPRYSMTEPIPPPVPMLAMIESTTSFAVTPAGGRRRP